MDTFVFTKANAKATEVFNLQLSIEALETHINFTIHSISDLDKELDLARLKFDQSKQSAIDKQELNIVARVFLKSKLDLRNKLKEQQNQRVELLDELKCHKNDLHALMVVQLTLKQY